MSLRSHLVTIGICLATVLTVFYLIKKRKLREQYALVWMGVCIVMIVLACWRSLLDEIAEALGIYYAPSALFIFGMVFSFGLMLHFSVVITRLHRDNRRFATKLAELGASLAEDGAPSKGEKPPRVRPDVQKLLCGTGEGVTSGHVLNRGSGQDRGVNPYEIYQGCVSDPRD